MKLQYASNGQNSANPIQKLELLPETIYFENDLQWGLISSEHTIRRITSNYVCLGGEYAY